MGAVDGEGVVARAGPDPDALGEGAVSGGPVGDRAGGQADQVDLLRVAEQRCTFGIVHRGVAAQGDGSAVGEEHRGVTDGGGLVADEQRVAAGPQVEVQGAVDVVEVAGEELGPAGHAHVGARRQVDPVVTGPQGDVGDRQGPTDVEHVGTGAEREVERLEPVVADTLPAAQVGRRSAGTESDELDRHRMRRVLVHLAAEADVVVAAELPHVDARRAPRLACGAAGHRDARVGADGLREQQQLERRTDLLGGRADREGHGTDAGGDAAAQLGEHDRERGRAGLRPHGVELVERPTKTVGDRRGHHVEPGE